MFSNVFPCKCEEHHGKASTYLPVHSVGRLQSRPPQPCALPSSAGSWAVPRQDGILYVILPTCSGSVLGLLPVGSTHWNTCISRCPGSIISWPALINTCALSVCCRWASVTQLFWNRLCVRCNCCPYDCLRQNVISAFFCFALSYLSSSVCCRDQCH